MDSHVGVHSRITLIVGAVKKICHTVEPPISDQPKCQAKAALMGGG